MAHAPSTSYRLKKFLRRNRLHVGAALALVIVVAAAIILSVWNQHQVRIAKAQGMRQAKILSEARRLVTEANFTEALQILRPILESEDVGFEARVLFSRIIGGDHKHQESAEIQAVMNKHYLERVSYYTKKIQTDPADPNNNLQRAQQYHYLNEKAKVRADMDEYRAILNPPKGTAAYDDRLRSLVTQDIHSEILFGAPENLGPTVNSAYLDGIADMSSDGLELYFESDRLGGLGETDIWVTKRRTMADLWEPAVNLGTLVNDSQSDFGPCIFRDGLALYFSSNRSGGSGGADIYIATRITIEGPWEEPVNLGPIVNSSAWDQSPSITADGLSLFFGSNREKAGTVYSKLCYIYVTTRATKDDPWSEPVRLGQAVNPGLAYDSDYPSISDDGLSLYFRRLYTSEQLYSGERGLWVATRTSVSDSWSKTVYLGLRGASPRFSADGSFMTYTSRAYGGYGNADLFQVPVISMTSKATFDGQADSLKGSKQNDNGREVVPKQD